MNDNKIGIIVLVVVIVLFILLGFLFFYKPKNTVNSTTVTTPIFTQGDISSDTNTFTN